MSIFSMQAAILAPAFHPLNSAEVKIKSGDLELDIAVHAAWISGEALNLTSAEFDLLRMFSGSAWPGAQA
jgi:two-component system, OmpR family, response regulator RstA